MLDFHKRLAGYERELRKLKRRKHRIQDRIDALVQKKLRLELKYWGA